MKLTKRQFELLIEGLSSLEKQSGSDSMMKAMLGTILIPRGQDKDEFLQEQKREMEEQKLQGQSLKKEIIIIKARLYEAEDELIVGSEIVEEK